MGYPFEVRQTSEEGLARLRRVEPSGPGYSRRRRGRGFSYHDTDGAAITDPATVARIRALAVPPAWRDVWIRALSDVAKHDRVLRLGRRLPAVRALIREQLERGGRTPG